MSWNNFFYIHVCDKGCVGFCFYHLQLTALRESCIIRYTSLEMRFLKNFNSWNALNSSFK